MDLSWYVYRQNMDTGAIVPFNIFRHYDFCRDVENEIKKYSLSASNDKDKSDFAISVKSRLMYYFWSKAEYEIVLKNWIGSDCEIKIDVYDQVMLNFSKFIDYLWSLKV